MTRVLSSHPVAGLSLAAVLLVASVVLFAGPPLAVAVSPVVAGASVVCLGCTIRMEET